MMLKPVSLSRWVFFFTGVLACCLLAGSLQAAPTFPTLTGRVVDAANLLPASLQQKLTQQLQAYEDKTTNQVVVVTVNTLQGYDIVDYGYQLGRHWGIGQAGKDNGVLFIVAPKERKGRIEVGYGLEGTLTDALSKQLIDTEIIPRFKQKDYAGGIEAGTNAIIGILSGTIAPKAFKKSRHIKKDVFPIFIAIVFFSIITGFFLKAWLGLTVSSMIIFAGAFGIGYLIAGLGFGFAVAIFSILAHLNNNSSGRTGGGGFGQA